MGMMEGQIDPKILFLIVKGVMSEMLNLSVLDAKGSGIAAENAK